MPDPLPAFLDRLDADATAIIQQYGIFSRSESMREAVHDAKTIVALVAVAREAASLLRAMEMEMADLTVEGEIREGTVAVVRGAIAQASDALAALRACLAWRARRRCRRRPE